MEIFGYQMTNLISTFTARTTLWLSFKQFPILYFSVTDTIGLWDAGAVKEIDGEWAQIQLNQMNHENLL